MEPSGLASNDPEDLRVQQRNAFYESLSTAARDRFLVVLQEAKERGLPDEAAWEEAVVAAETTYAGAE